MADERKKVGNDKFEAGQYEDAIAEYTAGLEIDDTNHILYSNRAAANLALKRWEDARADSLKCIAIKETFTKAYLRLATAQKELGELDEAMVTVKKGIAMINAAYAGKRGVKKVGMNDFVQLEKEITALNRERQAEMLSSKSSSSQITGGGSAASNEKTQKLGQQHLTNRFHLMRCRQELEEKEMSKREKSVVVQALDQQLGNKTNPICYRAIGKGFILQQLPEIKENLERETKKVTEEIENLQKGAWHLKRNVDESQAALQEHLKSSA